MKSIIFSESMINAILKKKKSQTRRLVKNIDLPKDNITSYNSRIFDLSLKNTIALQIFRDIGNDWNGYYIPLKYNIGDLVYVKEPFFHEKESDYYFLKYENMEDCSWKSPLFMPERFSRLKLKITDISIEKIQDISEEDCIKEGIFFNELFKQYVVRIGKEWKGSGNPKDCFKWLWDSLYKDKPEFQWSSNPWVIVYNFEVVVKE